MAGADGSGHVAVLHLYAKHIYPSLQGWIPELFGGMPFPIYYPPLFYWLGATIMRLTGMDAAFVAKLITSVSFAALPGSLFVLGQRLGLRSMEALLAAASAGVVACGSNVVSLSGIGLLGLFEVGLFTQTLGFVCCCLWAACLPGSGRSRRASFGAILLLVGTILSNAHILPLVAFCALTWFSMSIWWAVKGRVSNSVSRLVLQTVGASLLLIAPVLISGIWLIPLLKWYPYAVGQPIDSAGLFTAIGSLNIVWPLCAYVCWKERNHLRYLSMICAAVLITAFVSLTPLGAHLKYIPFQPSRVIAGALLLCTIPVTKIASDMMADFFRGERRIAYALLAIGILALAWLHPIQRFGIGSLVKSEADQLDQVRAALEELPSGKVLVEIVEPKAIFNSPENRTQEMALSRALTHEIARDGRPVLWSVFREQSLISPFATTVSNLFSTSKETFGLSGLGLQRSVEESVSVPNRLTVAKNLGVAYFLVKTGGQARVLQSLPEVQLSWTINGWSLFKNSSADSAEIRATAVAPVFAWLPANSKSRNTDDVDLFNLGEQLALDGHPDVIPLWAESEGVDVWDSLNKLPNGILVIDPASISSDQQKWLKALSIVAAKLRLILLDDDSTLSAQIHEQCQNAAACVQIKVHGYSRKAILVNLEGEILKAKEQIPIKSDQGPWVWRTSFGYFPAWQTADHQSTYLTGQGSAAVISATVPSLQWNSKKVFILSLMTCMIGLLASFLFFRYFDSGFSMPENFS